MTTEIIQDKPLNPRALTREAVIAYFIEAHGDTYDYSLVDYVNSNTKVEIICKVHGSFKQRPADHKNGRGCSACGHKKAGVKTRTSIPAIGIPNSSGVKLIKDLGVNNSMQRVGLYECPHCNKEYEVAHTKVRTGLWVRCYDCGYTQTSHKRTAHGESDTRLHIIWKNMKQRTRNKNNSNYVSYGGRGIKMCDDWFNDYTVFAEWAKANGYDDSLSIDRIDNDGNYEPSNCRWTNKTIQAVNQRKSASKTGVLGVFPSTDSPNYYTSIKINGKDTYIGSGTIGECIDMRNKYIVDNNLPHRLSEEV